MSIVNKHTNDIITHINDQGKIKYNIGIYIYIAYNIQYNTKLTGKT